MRIQASADLFKRPVLVGMVIIAAAAGYAAHPVAAASAGRFVLLSFLAIAFAATTGIAKQAAP